MMDDSYSKPVTVGNEQHKKVINTKFVKKRGPRRLKSGLQVQRDRPETKELRYLAPGRMKDYYNMMLAQHPEGKAVVSFATFYRAPRMTTIHETLMGTCLIFNSWPRCSHQAYKQFINTVFPW